MKTFFGRHYLTRRKSAAIILGIIDFLGGLIFRLRGPKKPPSTVRKVLVSRIDRYEDVFMASSILPHLRRAYPSARIHFLAGRRSLRFLQSNEHVERVLLYDSFRNNPGDGPFRKAYVAAKDFLRDLREIRSERYDLSIDLSTGPLNSSPLLYLGGGGFKVGFSTGGFGFLLDKVIPYSKGVHEVAHMADALKAIGIEADMDKLRPGYRPTRATVKEGLRILEGLGIGADEPFVLIHTGSDNNAKEWSASGWQGLIDGINNMGGVKVLAYDTTFGEGLKGVLRLPSLISFELFSAIAGRAALFVGLDSFPAHVAAALDTPTVVVWCGIEDHALRAPVGGLVRIVRKAVGCAPCGKACGCAAMECMEIPADDCLNEVKSVLEAVKPAMPARVVKKVRGGLTLYRFR